MHCVLVFVAAFRTTPDKFAVFLDNFDFAVVSAFFAQVRFCVQFGIQNRVVDMLNYGEYCRDIVLHVRYFNIADCSAGGESLKFGFFCEFIKCVDVLSDIDVI